MKKINFDYENSINPRGTGEGLGIKPGLMLCDADYYCSMAYDGDNYIIAKVVEDKYNKYPQLLNKFIVRQALYDIYADGSGSLFLNQEENNITQQLENYLNSYEVKDFVNNINVPKDIINIIPGAYSSPRSFILAELNDRIYSVSIIPEAFQEKNDAIKNCSSSISELQMDANNKYTR